MNDVKAVICEFCEPSEAGEYLRSKPFSVLNASLMLFSFAVRQPP